MAKGKRKKNDLDSRKELASSLGLWDHRDVESLAASKLSRAIESVSNSNANSGDGKCPFEELIELHDHEHGDYHD